MLSSKILFAFLIVDATPVTYLMLFSNFMHCTRIAPAKFIEMNLDLLLYLWTFPIFLGYLWNRLPAVLMQDKSAANFCFFICFTWQVVVRLLSLNLKLNIVAVCFFSVFILFMYHVFFTVLALHNRFLILCWPFSQYPFILFGTLCYCTTLCCLIN